ncbi:hypothetical protein E8E14_005690 [Neopestalotiopsis sp. 37M]|nr:hypothetical protein E8E14_005690 [Neopestalotiopsis sp. 37M]
MANKGERSQSTGSEPEKKPANSSSAVAPAFNPRDFQAFLDLSQGQLIQLTAAERSAPADLKRLDCLKR